MNAAEQLIERGRVEGRAEGLERGRVEALRTAIVKVLSARGMPQSDEARARLADCADFAVLTRWLERAATAASEVEVFAGPDAP